MIYKISALLIMLSVGISAIGQTNKKKKILFVVTSHSEKGNTGEKTGYFLSEVAHPWKVLTHAGYEIDFVSPLGGNPPVDGFDMKDPINKEFWENKEYQNKISHSMKPSEVKPMAYDAIYYAGGHGAMWDLPNDTSIAKLATKIYEQNGVVAAVCHGPAGLVNIKLSTGSFLIADKKINGFSNAEEEAIGLTKVVPFLLEDKLSERGAIYEKAGLWEVHAVTDKRLVTGQNPQSATAVAQAMLTILKK